MWGSRCSGPSLPGVVPGSGRQLLLWVWLPGGGVLVSGLGLEPLDLDVAPLVDLDGLAFLADQHGDPQPDQPPAA